MTVLGVASWSSTHSRARPPLTRSRRSEATVISPVKRADHDEPRMASGAPPDQSADRAPPPAPTPVACSVGAPVRAGLAQ